MAAVVGIGQWVVVVGKEGNCVLGEGHGMVEVGQMGPQGGGWAYSLECKEPVLKCWPLS